MTAPGMPDKMESSAGESIPVVKNSSGMSMQFTSWRCMQCGEGQEYGLGRHSHFQNCPKCGGSRWAFAEARQ